MKVFLGERLCDGRTLLFLEKVRKKVEFHDPKIGKIGNSNTVPEVSPSGSKNFCLTNWE